MGVKISGQNRILFIAIILVVVVIGIYFIMGSENIESGKNIH